MEISIRTFTKTLASFCNHLQTTADALKQSVDRRPLPLDSASSTFVQCLNRRVSSAGADLDLLESMSFGTVSFEELLGHCYEVFKKNQDTIAKLEDRLTSLGYTPELEIADDDEVSGLSTPCGPYSKLLGTMDGLDSPITYTSSILKQIEEDSLSDESLNLRSLGLSDACLATLASEANGDIDSPDASLLNSVKRYDNKHEIRESHQSSGKIVGMIEGIDQKPIGADKSKINISRDDYECLPSYMKSLSSWEDLLIAVEKINSNMSKIGKPRGNFFHQDELASLELGPKARSYLLLLVRMNRLVVETVDGSISYRVL